MDRGIIGLCLMFGAIVVSRVYGERALKTLTPEQKVRLLDGFSRFRVLNLIPIVVLFIGYVGGLRYFPEHATELVIASLIAVLVLFAINHVLIARKLREIDTPPTY